MHLVLIHKCLIYILILRGPVVLEDQPSALGIPVMPLPLDATEVIVRASVMVEVESVLQELNEVEPQKPVMPDPVRAILR